MGFTRKHLIATLCAGCFAAICAPALAENTVTRLDGPSIDKLTAFSALITSPRNLATNIIGADLFSMDEKKIGTVEDIVLDNDGKMIAIKVDAGGFLGLDEIHLAVPIDEIRFGLRDGALRLSADIVEQDIRDLNKD